MFTQLTRLWFGDQQEEEQQQQQQSRATTTGVENELSNLTSTEADDEWILVDRHRVEDDGADSEGNSEYSWSSKDEDDNLILLEESAERVVVMPLRRSSSSSSLPNSRMEESWFLTPPPCFISTGPVHMETSPFENLLIEHPSMSVYTHHGRRQHLMVTGPSTDVENDEQAVEQVEVEDDGDVVVVVRRRPVPNRGQVIQQQQRQGVKNKQAQKVQIKKSCKVFNRGQLDRNNKAREVNSRNRRQRRGERSQGAQRSHANNNRKC